MRASLGQCYVDRAASLEQGRQLQRLQWRVHALVSTALPEALRSCVACRIEGKTPEEIRETLSLPDDLSEEEKLEPISYHTDDPRIR